MTNRQKLFLMVLSTGLAIALATGVRQADQPQMDHSSFVPGFAQSLLNPQS